MRRSTLIAPAGLKTVAAAAVALYPPGSATASAPALFSYGQPQGQTVGASECGTDTAGEPSLHTSSAYLAGTGSENGFGGSSVFQRVPRFDGSGEIA